MSRKRSGWRPPEVSPTVPERMPLWCNTGKQVVPATAESMRQTAAAPQEAPEENRGPSRVELVQQVDIATATLRRVLLHLQSNGQAVAPTLAVVNLLRDNINEAIQAQPKRTNKCE